VIALFLLLAFPAQADCPAPITGEQLAASVDRAQGAFAAMDLTSFTVEARKVTDDLGCVRVYLTGPDAAGVHRIRALNAYIQQRPDEVLAAFRSALAADPDAGLSEEIAPQGNLLRDLFNQARAATDPPPKTVDVPPKAVLGVDGQTTRGLPADRPAVVQLGTSDLLIFWTGILEPGDALPEWRTVGYEPPPLETRPESRRSPPKESTRARKPSVPLLVAAGSAALISGTLYSVALANKAAYKNTDNPNMQSTDDLQGLRRQTNTLAGTSIGLGTVAVGLGAWAWIEVAW